MEQAEKTDYNGQVFIWYLILFSLNRGIVEFFRFNPSFLGILSISHLLSLLFIVAATPMMVHLKKKHPASDNKGKDKSFINGWGFAASLVSVLLLALVSVAVYYLAWA